MAYVTQADKKVISDALKVALKEYPSVKFTLSIQHQSTITCTIKQGPKCLTPKNGEYATINHYHIDKQNSVEAAKILNIINSCMHIGHFDHSDIQSDYFHCAWYVGIKIGTWDKPYVSV